MLTFITIILVLLLITVATYFILRRLNIVDNIFGNSITRRVEKKKRLEGQVEVLKKQQKVESEAVIKTYEVKRKAIIDETDAQIASLKAQIASLNANKESSCKLLDEERKVSLDKTINDFDMKIVSKQNQVKRLGRFIKAEHDNIQDVIEPDQPNAPTERRPIGFGQPIGEKKPLLESKSVKKPIKK